jgi:drug/metabolite transporter (DMT)-like permease
VFVIGLAAAALLGVGWVLQQRATARSDRSELLSWRLLRELIGSWTWWAGIGAVAAGQSMSAWALQLGPVTLVEPLLASCLLFAFGVSAFTARRWLRWQELLGLLSR